MNANPSAYRPDIDGLRAVAVAAVLLFHAFPDAVSGGFVGVDIFFVISGYLITGILVREAMDGRFSILRFYVRRARRIFPALIFVLACTIGMSWLMLFPLEWQQLGKHVAAGVAFVSNLALWKEAGYFDGSSDLKPLLHLWSLAVEEQYYLAWPLVVYLAARRGMGMLAAVAAVLTLASLAACIAWTPGRPTAAFYLPVTRIWELLIGSGLAILQARQRALDAVPGRHAAAWAGAGSLAGLVAIAVAVATFDRSTAFPGAAALLPTLGAAMLIAAPPRSWVNRHVLAARPMVWVGLISYPLYLWHWPLLALARIWGGGATPAAARAALVALAVLLAWLTYRVVEAPLRDARRNQRAARDAAWLWGILILLGGLGVLIWTQHWLPRSAVSPVVRQLAAGQVDWEDVPNQRLTGNLAGRVLFVGDSHMQHYLPRVAQVLRTTAASARSASIITLSGCAPLPGLNRVAVDCAGFTDLAYAEMLKPDVQTVVLAGSWVGATQRPDYYRSGDPRRTHLVPFSPGQEWLLHVWTERLRSLTQLGKRVVVVLSSPRGDAVDPRKLVDRNLWLWDSYNIAPRPRAQLKQTVEAVDSQVRQVAQAAGAEIIDPFDALCGPSACPVLTPDGLPIFIDDSHLRSSYVRREWKAFDHLLLGD